MSQLHSEGLSILDNLTDPSLLQRFVRHADESAFAALVRRHGPLVLGVCRRVLQHTQDTEDAFQATFLVLARKARSIQNFESLSGWLYRVAYRIALRARAHRANRQAQESRFMTERGRPAPAARDREVDLLVDEEVQRLPEKYRTPVLLCYLQGQTNEEAAQLLRCPTGTIKIRLLRGREMLRRRLRRQGVALSLTVWFATQVTSAKAAVPSHLLSSVATAAGRLQGGLGLGQLGLPSAAIQSARSWFKRVALAKVKIGAAMLTTILLLVLTDHLAQKAGAATAAATPKAAPTDRMPQPPAIEHQSPSEPESRLPDVLVDQRVPDDDWADTQ